MVYIVQRVSEIQEKCCINCGVVLIQTVLGLELDFKVTIMWSRPPLGLNALWSRSSLGLEHSSSSSLLLFLHLLQGQSTILPLIGIF